MKKIDKPLYESLGKQLKEARLNKGYSLADVAEKVGKSKVSIKRYEDAVARIDMDTLEKMCNVLDLRPIHVNYFTKDRNEHTVHLRPLREGDKPVENLAERERNSYLSWLSHNMIKKLIELDVDSQRIVLMMLKMEDIDETLNRLNETR